MDSDYLLANSSGSQPFSAELPDGFNRAFYRKQLSGWCYRANRGKGQDDAIAKGHRLARDIGREGRLSDTTLLLKESNGRHGNTEKRKSVLL